MKPLQIVKAPAKQRTTVFLRPSNREKLYKLAGQKKVAAGHIVDLLIEERLK